MDQSRPQRFLCQTEQFCLQSQGERGTGALTQKLTERQFYHSATLPVLDPEAPAPPSRQTSHSLNVKCGQQSLLCLAFKVICVISFAKCKLIGVRKAFVLALIMKTKRQRVWRQYCEPPRAHHEGLIHVRPLSRLLQSSFLLKEITIKDTLEDYLASLSPVSFCSLLPS